MISAAERQERLEAVEDVIGTHRAEGIALSFTTVKIMRQYANGDFTLEQFSAAMRMRANTLSQSMITDLALTQSVARS